MLKLGEILESQHRHSSGVKAFLILSILLTLVMGAFVSYKVFQFRASTLAALANSAEGEDATLSGDVVKGTDTTASGGQYIQFGSQNVNPQSNFQPTSPYYSTFYYPWFQNLQIDGSWGSWQQSNHNPPHNWFSNYVPNYDPARFDPANELYSTGDIGSFYWQLNKMAEAKIEASISSWWGQGHRTDLAFGKIVKNLMNRSDNPYPNLRWTIYYEKEATSLSGSSPNNPSATDIASDLQYLSTNYFSQKSYFKIGGKPVVFVYADAGDGCSMVDRWKSAISQSGVSIYLVLKLFNGYTSCANQPDSWHQYAPATRQGQHGAYSYYVSPGFWLDGQTVRLPRNLTDFESAVAKMVSANTTWKLIETWNEWGEGTSVEPGEEVVQTKTGDANLNQNPTQGVFNNSYIDILSRNLPLLEAGTGR